MWGEDPFRAALRGVTCVGRKDPLRCSLFLTLRMISLLCVHVGLLSRRGAFDSLIVKRGLLLVVAWVAVGNRNSQTCRRQRRRVCSTSPNRTWSHRT